jgi:hypothetical protein
MKEDSMRRRKLRGVSYVEFAFCVLLLVPLLLGATGVGLNLLLAYQTSQVARDAGHIYARQQNNFAIAGSQTILATLGSGIGLTATSGVSGSAGTGNALVVFSTVSYVDDNSCALGGYATAGVHTAACKNFGSWVFRQRILVGNLNLMATNYGSPVSSGNGHGNPLVTIDSSGNISATDQLTNPNDVATFSAINPYSSTNGGSGLPSGQVIYITEVAAKGFVLPPFQSNPMQYAYNMF